MKPYISFVLAGRNDNYGRNFLSRLQNCVNVLIGLCNKYQLDSELILVDWNSPEIVPKLKYAVRWPQNEIVKIRIIEVSPKIHNTFKNSNKIPFFEFLAKNSGIRRADGEYVLSINSDVILSEQLIKYFSLRRLLEKAFYRVERYDFDGDIPQNISLEEQLQFCERNIFRVYSLHGQLPVNYTKWLKHTLLERLERLRVEGVRRKFRKLIKKILSPFLPNGDAAKIKALANRWRGLYINAGGDFTLASKKSWDFLKGYPELGLDRAIDCYLIIEMYYAGLAQVFLPYPIYHQEHGRIENLPRPTAILDEIPEFIKMVETGKVVPFNGDNWGLKNFDLPEFRID